MKKDKHNKMIRLIYGPVVCDHMLSKFTDAPSSGRQIKTFVYHYILTSTWSIFFVQNDTSRHQHAIGELLVF